MPELDPLWLVEQAKPAVVALVTLFLGWIFAGIAQGWAAKGMRTARLDEALTRFLSSLVRYTIIAAVVLAAADAFGIKITSLMAIFASAGLAVGLALQGTLTHFASGVMILFFRPFTIGDKITAAGHTGDVKEIGLFATTLMLLDNTKIIIPNGGITSGSISNITAQGTVRGSVEIGVAYGSDMKQAIKVLEAAAASSPLIAKDAAAPAAALVSFGGSSIDFQVHCWSAPGDFLNMMHDVRIRVYDALNEAGIDIPFQTVTILKGD